MSMNVFGKQLALSVYLLTVLCIGYAPALYMQYVREFVCTDMHLECDQCRQIPSDICIYSAGACPMHEMVRGYTDR